MRSPRKLRTPLPDKATRSRSAKTLIRWRRRTAPLLTSVGNKEKSEVRISKSERTPNEQNRKFKTDVARCCARFEHSYFEHCFGFRISSFEFLRPWLPRQW